MLSPVGMTFKDWVVQIAVAIVACRGCGSYVLWDVAQDGCCTECRLSEQ